MARPQAKIDPVELEKLCTMQCTDEEVAAFFGVSTRTIERRRLQPRFAEVMERARAKGRVSVRRSLFRLANNGNIAAAIFLSKNLLGYRDVVNTEHSGLAGGPIQIAARPDLSQLTDEELKQLRAIADKALPSGRN
ncbi:MAG TPA: hypothetical protein VFD98_14475 [Terracidiphilus sp.]|jgi:hypothetical protein|nr:hypothetical protein [Terracidiphilus sp.]